MFGLAEASSDVGKCWKEHGGGVLGKHGRFVSVVLSLGATSESADGVYLSQIKVKIITMRLELYFMYQ